MNTIIMTAQLMSGSVKRLNRTVGKGFNLVKFSRAFVASDAPEIAKRDHLRLHAHLMQGRVEADEARNVANDIKILSEA